MDVDQVICCDHLHSNQNEFGIKLANMQVTVLASSDSTLKQNSCLVRLYRL